MSLFFFLSPAIQSFQAAFTHNSSDAMSAIFKYASWRSGRHFQIWQQAYRSPFSNMADGVVVATFQYGGWRYFQTSTYVSSSFIFDALAAIFQHGGGQGLFPPIFRGALFSTLFFLILGPGDKSPNPHRCPLTTTQPNPTQSNLILTLT